MTMLAAHEHCTCGAYAPTDVCREGHSMRFDSWGRMQGAYYWCDDCGRSFVVIDWCECED